ncbi:MAG: hypothetical protein IT271_01875 [Chitinophagales bacterium]|nr:hypothetical protein [Chitinophagales bacterium]
MKNHPNTICIVNRNLVMNHYHLTFIGITLILSSCSSLQKKEKANISNTIIKTDSKIDTTKIYSLLDLNPYSKKLSNYEKQKKVLAAIQTLNEENFFSIYFKELSMSDFYLLDIDLDGDLDILYSSLSNQYRLTDRNGLEILRNNNNTYTAYSVPGYLYSTNLFTKSDSIFSFKTIMRPCCDYTKYTFFETSFNPKTWTLSKPEIIETIDRKNIKEKI